MTESREGELFSRKHGAATGRCRANAGVVVGFGASMGEAAGTGSAASGSAPAEHGLGDPYPADQENRPRERHHHIGAGILAQASWHRTSWITISGVTLTETTSGDNYAARSSGAGDGRTYCGEALHLRGTAPGRVDVVGDSHFHAVGGNAIDVKEQNGRDVMQKTAA